MAVAALVAAGLLAGCAQAPKTPPTPTPPAPAPAALEGTAWRLTELNAQSLVPDAAAPTLRFTGDRVSVNDGCGRYIGPAMVSGATLRIGRDLASSRRPCSEAVQAGADAFSRALARTVAYRGDSGSLVLVDPGGAALATFVAQPPDLTGPVWRLLGPADGTHPAVGARSGSPITVAFDAEGRVRGAAGCASYTGTWTLADRRLSVSPLQPVGASTACARSKRRQGQDEAVLLSLSRAVDAQREGERLALHDATGALVATATAMPAPAPVSRRRTPP
jgi:heat shock protein HslJ